MPGHKFRRLDGVGDVLVAVAHTLIAADFGVLALALLHQGLELGVIALGDSLGLHLDCQVAACRFNAVADLDNGILQAGNTDSLIQACAGENVERRRHKLDLDLGFLSVLGLSCAKSGLDSIDSLVTEAGDLDIGSDLGGLGCESLADVGLELLGSDLVGEGDVVPNLGVACSS